MKPEYFDAYLKRKSFHLFTGVGKEKIAPEEISAIEEAFRGFESLYPGIRTALRVVSTSEVAYKSDAEYCLLLYSEKKENYLLNAGYLGEQLDLYLVSRGIGSLWFGLGKTEEKTFDGLDFVIMFAIRKVSGDGKFRKEMKKAKRKPLAEVWSGDTPAFADLARFSPSACNSQPWFVENKDGALTIYRRKRAGRVGIMPPWAVSYFNRIDMGIYLCVLEICMEKAGFTFARELFVDDDGGAELIPTAAYTTHPVS